MEMRSSFTINWTRYSNTQHSLSEMEMIANPRAGQVIGPVVPPGDVDGVACLFDGFLF
jgi:hypothetical protein